MVRVLVAGQDLVLRRGLRAVIEEHRCGTVVGETRAPRETLETAMRLRPDVVVLAVSSVDTLRVIPSLSKFTRVVVLSHWADGLPGCLVHGQYTLMDLLNLVRHGSSPVVTGDLSPMTTSGSADMLSPREIEVMDHVAEGMDNTEIARVLGVRVKTVKNHITSIFAKLGVRTRAQAIVRWLAPSGERVAG